MRETMSMFCSLLRDRTLLAITWFANILLLQLSNIFTTTTLLFTTYMVTAVFINYSTLLITKTLMFYIVSLIIRGTLPRYQVSSLIRLCWKILFFMLMANFLVLVCTSL